MCRNPFFLLVICIAIACNTPNNPTIESNSSEVVPLYIEKTPIPCQEQIQQAFELGNFSESEGLITNCLQHNVYTSEQSTYLLRLRDKMRRIRLEFSLTRSDIQTQIQKVLPDVTDEQIDEWEESRLLEVKVIDGRKQYFKQAVNNLFRLLPHSPVITSRAELFCAKYITAILTDSVCNLAQPDVLFDKKRMQITYTIALKANVIPSGELVRCWMPFPRINKKRLVHSKLLSTSEDQYVFSPSKSLQHSLYMEKQAVENKPTVFKIVYEIETNAHYFAPELISTRPYNTADSVYMQYLKEEPPHILLTDTIRDLAQRIVGESTKPNQQVDLLLNWLNDSIPWASALEYAIMDNISDYVLTHKRGDCGMQTFLFLSMARSLGIPCKWQSGWYLYPNNCNLHDWAEVYFPDVGWVPVDPSFKLLKTTDARAQKFYRSGMDGYRLIINDAVAQPLVPEKIHWRSEPFDFQRGEVEWRGGNLYFDTWNYSLQVNYITP